MKEHPCTKAESSTQSTPDYDHDVRYRLHGSTRYKVRASVFKKKASNLLECRRRQMSTAGHLAEKLCITRILYEVPKCYEIIGTSA